MLAVLPPELLLQVLSYATFPVLANLLRTSKAWNSIIDEHEAAIYRRAAYLHAFTEDTEVSFEETVENLHGHFWADEPVQGWKNFCEWFLACIRRAPDEDPRSALV
jgi:hypothetical protein